MRRWNRPVVLWLLFAATVVSPLSSRGQTDAGEENANQNLFRDDYSVDVDPFSGTFATTVNIEVPKFHGIEPKLQLQYSSSGRNGFVGVGWTLSGFSYIERVSPGKGAPSYGVTDTYMLDGMELVACTTLGGTHCTRIQNHKQISLGIDQIWRVREKNGTTTTYKLLLSSGVGGVNRFRYGIDTVTDTHGNTVTYGYSCPDDCYPNSITYNGTIITIASGERDDDLTFSDGGPALRNHTKRLTEIDIKVSNVRARRYVMDWGTADATNGGRSLLRGVRHFGTDNTTQYPEIQFTYENETGTQGTFATPVQATGLSTFQTGGSQVLTGDFDGNGFTDVFMVPNSANNSTTANNYRTWYSTGDGQYDDFITTLTSPALTDGQWLTGDIDGDGDTDLVYAPLQTIGATIYIWFSGGASHTWSRGTAVKAGGSPTTPNSYDSFWIAGDFNGDGKSELAQAGNNGELYFWQWTSGFTFAVTERTPGTGGEVLGDLTEGHWFPTDFNGDGKTDLAFISHTTSGILSYISKGDLTFNRYSYPHPAGYPGWTSGTSVVGKWRIGDFNGDGKTDIFHVGEVNGQLTLYYSRGGPTTGDGFTPQSFSPPGGYPNTLAGWWFPININGDGKTDLYHMVQTAPTGTIYLWMSQDAPGTWANSSIVAPSTGGYDLPFQSGRLQSGDIDGDGRDDFIHIGDSAAGTDKAWTWLNSGAADNRLKQVKNRTGGTVDVTYVPSTNWINTFLPVGMVTQTVATIKRSDGRGANHTDTYQYAGAKWNSAEHCFLGFGNVKRRLDTVGTFGNYEETVAFQSNNCTTKPQAVYQRNYLNQIYSYTTFDYVDKTNTPPFYTLEKARSSYECNLDTCGFATSRTLLYDNNTDPNNPNPITYGNVTRTVEYGDVSSPDDNRTIDHEFYPKTVSGYIADRVAREVTYEGTSTLTRKAESRFIYDGNATYNAVPSIGELKKLQVWDSTQGVSFYREHPRGYDSFGNLTSETDARGNVSTTSYDSTYHIFPYQICSPLLAQPAGPALQLCTTQTWNVVLGKLHINQDPNGAQTIYDYDALARLQYTTHPDTTVTENQYFTIGTPTTQHVRTIEPDHADGLVTDFYFDGFGREWKRQRDNGETQLTNYAEVTDRVDSKSVTYDPATETARYHIYTYDNAKRVVRIDEPGSTGPAPVFTQITYGDGNVLTTDPLGKVKTTYRDGFGRVKRTTEQNLGFNYNTYYYYDALDNLVQVTDAMSNSATFAYDSISRKGAACDFDMGCWAYVYDADGDLLTQTDAKLQTTTYTYDELKRVKTKTNQAGELTQWFYDEAGHGASLGRLTQVVYPGGSESFTYNNMGLETQIIRCVAGDCRTINQTYIAGRLNTLQYPDGEVVTYGYDNGGYLVSLNGTSAYVTNTIRNARGQIKTLSYGNGTTTTNDYNNPYDLISSASVSGPGGALYQAGYTYTKASQILTVSSTTHPEMNSTYGYDDLYRLTTVTANGPATRSQSFNYDAIGNMTSNSDVGTYFYTELGKPHAVSRAGNFHYEYDLNGNLTSVTTRTSDCVNIIRLLGWDTENRVAFASAGGNTTRYTYSGRNERIQKSGPGGTTNFYGSLVEVKDPAGAKTLVKYYYAGALLVAKREAGTPYWYHRDQVDTPRALSDTSGQQAAKYEYEPFGEKISSTGTAPNQLGFGSHYQDNETDLVFMGSRYYDPALSRFMQPDSIVPQPDDPQSWNRYSYARNNPVNRVDPTGHADWFNWDTALDVAQLGIGVAGMIPAVGNIADAANVAISLARGDMIGAAMDAASMIEGAGQATGAVNIEARLGRIVAKNADEGAVLVRAVERGLEKGADGVRGAAKVAGEVSEPAAKAVKAAAAGDAPTRVVIGENMERVQRYADEIGAETFKGEGMAANRAWVDQAKQEGKEVIDIGPDFGRRRERIQQGRRPDSEAYNMERQNTRDYDKYQKAFERNGRLEGGVSGFDD